MTTSQHKPTLLRLALLANAAMFSGIIAVPAHAHDTRPVTQTAADIKLAPAVRDDLEETSLPIPQDDPMIALAEELSIPQLASDLASGQYSSEELVRGYQFRISIIDQTGPNLRSIIAQMPDALEQARILDAERAAGKIRGPLHGIPIIIKDNIDAAGPVPTTAGSFALIDNVTDRDAPLVANLKAAGAIIIAKANLSQWANIRSSSSTSGWTSVGGLVKNPYALDRNACGSSSGSGAAMAASLGGGAVGTETDGSIICPATTTGIVGFKPTLGLVSRTFIIPISHSQDTAGPMTRTVQGAAMMLTAMAGSDAADSATKEADKYAINFANDLNRDYLKGVRIGVLRDRLGDDATTQKVFETALADLKKAGAILVDIDDSRSGFDGLGRAEFEVLMTELKADLNAYLASTPASNPQRNLADLIQFNKDNASTELRYFGQEFFELAQSKNGLGNAEYLAALEKSKRLAGPEGIDRLLEENQVQFLVGPSGGPAWRSDLVIGDTFSGPSQSQLAAISGYPHLTVPMGYVEGLPVGISFISGKWSDHAVLKAGYAYEQISQKRVAPQYHDNLPLEEAALPFDGDRTEQ